MESSIIEKILTKDPFTAPWYSGIAHPDVCIQRISKFKSKKPQLFVLNTDNSYGPGEHLCLAFFFPPSNCEFFDPLGFHPKTYGFDSPLKDHASLITFNNIRVQSFFSSTCGHHCLYYALKRARGDSPETIMRTYQPFNFAFNDKMVFNFVSDNFGPVSAKISHI
jgi:hypothetical protein